MQEASEKGDRSWRSQKPVLEENEVDGWSEVNFPVVVLV
jgi:hypothetical protein